MVCKDSTKEDSISELTEERQLSKLKKIVSFKAMLKEEEPQKLTKVIERIEGSYECLDKYVARITGVNIKVITVTRSWHRIIKRIILEEGKEILDIALEELEQDLAISVGKRNRETEDKYKVKTNSTERKVKGRKMQRENSNELQKAETKIEENILISQEAKELEKEDTNSRSILKQELEYLNRKLADRNKSAIEILFRNEQRVEARNSQLEVNPKKLTKESPQDLQEVELTFNKEIEDLALRIEDIILEDIDNAPLGTSQLEINDTKEYWKRQIDHAVANYKEPKGTALEDSIWAPNESTCENAGEYKAKVASVVLPGNTKEERIKFVEGTIYKNEHISKIEEYFIRGNAWIIISFDCCKGLEILKERIREKEIEWYKVIFEEDESQKNYKSTSDNKQSKNVKKENSKKVKEEKPTQDLYEKKGIDDSKSCEYKQVLGKRDTGKATNRISV